MRKCPDCKNESVIEDGYCGRCRQCTLSPIEPKVTPDKPREQGELRSKELLDALFEKYVAADTEARELERAWRESSTAFQAADHRSLIAWKEYKAAKDQQASNRLI